MDDETEFAVGDMVIRREKNDVPGLHRKVLGVHEFSTTGGETVTRLWLVDAANQDRGSGLASDYRKIVPKFEVGRTYRYVDGLVTVVSVSATEAIGWRANGTRWFRPQGAREHYEEVGVSVNADAHRALRILGIDLGPVIAPPALTGLAF